MRDSHHYKVDIEEVKHTNPYFTLQQVSEGVWAAIVIPGSGALGNASIIDLGDVTVVVDTFSLPQAAEFLRSEAELLTGKPVKYIVNTHYHGDHHYGNQVFAGSIIISTALTREVLVQGGAPDLNTWQSGLRNQIEMLEQGEKAAADPRLREALGYEIADKAALLAATPMIHRVTASVTFSRQLIIHGSARSITLLTYGGGHTESDAMVYIEDAKVLIAGDLILSHSHPAMLSGFTVAWIEILERIEREIDVNLVIPGHGGVTGRESITEMISYLTDIQAYAENAAQSGESADRWLEKGIPAPYDHWMMSHVYEWNFRWLFNLLLKEERG
ncbi:MBL fold metallo-hydrolase [Paenibacillus sp. sgz500992]|uniref:MBL fold metallo-hydrolase n=1 Tax=Paenibacillus sp. sgz500992 TaxID=3242476 RepID=UPI0036D2550C